MRILYKQDWYAPDKWMGIGIADCYRFGFPLPRGSYLETIRDLMLAGF